MRRLVAATRDAARLLCRPRQRLLICTRPLDRSPLKGSGEWSGRLGGTGQWRVLCSSASERVESRVFRDNVRHLPDGPKLTSGNLIEFRKDASLLLGVVERQLENKWVVYDQVGQDVVLLLPGSNYARSDLSIFVENAKGVDASCIEVAWQTMPKTSEPLTLTEMSRLLLNNDNAVSVYMTYTLLKNNRTYFRQISRNPALYHRTSPTEVQLLRENEKIVQEVQEEQKKFKDDVAAVLQKPLSERPDGEEWIRGKHKKRVMALKDFAVSDGPSMESRNLAMESLRVCGMSLTPNGAVRLLESIRVFRQHEPIALLRAGINAEFSEDILKAAEDIASEEQPDPDAAIRRDLTYLTAISIDEMGTREIDDALSVERLPDGQLKVWTHVSDPSRWIDLDSALDLEARKRVVSLYIPTGAIPVYPWKLAEGCFSLRTGVRSCALSFGAILDATGNIQAFDIVPSVIVPLMNFTYSEAEEAINIGKNEDLTTLVEISKLRRAWRQSQGAIEIDLPECDVKVSFTADDDSGRDPEVKLIKHSKDSLSRSMVSEFMILAGEIAGQVGRQQQLALPYRSQVAAVLPKTSELQKLPKGPCQQVAIRGRMTRGMTSSTQALPHASLGIQAYVQITSPIRRYSDYLAHVQLKAHLTNAPLPLSAPDLDSLLTMTSQIARRRSKAAEENINYWLAEYFRQHQETVWDATFLTWQRQSQGIATVLIDDPGLERQLRIDRPAKPGDKLRLRVAGVDVKNGSVRFEQV